LLDLLGERDRGKAKEIQHRVSQEWVRGSGRARSARHGSSSQQAAASASFNRDAKQEVKKEQYQVERSGFSETEGQRGASTHAAAALKLAQPIVTRLEQRLGAFGE
jgi:uncharacterized protein YfaS (alpha-2-macroglobulin family)